MQEDAKVSEEDEGESGRERDEPFEDDQVGNSTVQSFGIVKSRHEHVGKLLLEVLGKTCVLKEPRLVKETNGNDVRGRDENEKEGNEPRATQSFPDETS